jgi:ABC-type branched-subunit amino acid transport system ATPase component
MLADRRHSVLLVEQYYDLQRSWQTTYLVMERGEFIATDWAVAEPRACGK